MCIATFIQWCVCYASVQCMCTSRGRDGDTMYVPTIQSLETRYMYRKLGTQIDIESVVCTCTSAVELNRMHGACDNVCE